MYGQVIEQLDGMPHGTSARAIALGNAYVSETYDAMTMYWNPAALAYLQQYSVVSNLAMETSSQVFSHDLAFPVYVTNSNALAVGVQGSYYGQRWSAPYVAFHSLDFGFAQKVSSTVSFGILINARYSSAYGSSLWTGSGTIGAFYSPVPGISYGVAFNGIGWGSKFTTDELPAVIGYEKNLPKSLQVGATLRFPSYYQKPDFTISVADEKIMGRGESIYRAGLEIQITQFLVARTGIISLPTRAIIQTGAGISFGRFQLDYSYSRNELLKQNHFLSIAFALDPHL